jgi:hypothetical protein
VWLRADTIAVFLRELFSGLTDIRLASFVFRHVEKT